MMLRQLNIRVFYQAFILSAISLFLLSAHVNGQDRKVNLQQEKKQIEAEIAYTNDLLDKTRKNRQSSMEGLAILQQKIRQRERLVNNIKAELALIIQEIDETGDSIFTLTVELKKLKEEYAKMIYYANRHRGSYDRLVFIFSAEDFNQAYRRIKYFQQYSAYRRTQAELITSTQDALSLKELNLERQKAEQQNLLSQEQEEKNQLEFEKGDVGRTIQNLGQKEKKLKTDLRTKERAKAELD